MAKTVKRRVSYPRIIVALLLIVIIIIFIVDGISRSARKKDDKSNNKIITSTSTVENKSTEKEVSQSETTTVTTEDPNKIDETKFSVISKAFSYVNKGELILVNHDYKFNFDNYDLADENVQVYDPAIGNIFKFSNIYMKLNKNAVPKLNEMMQDFYDLYQKNHVTLTSSIRSYSEQNSLYTDDLSKTENDYSDLVAKPGYSEHHSGLAFDVTLVLDDGTPNTYDGTGDYSWINNNCYKYGFVVRYPEGKKEITKIDYEPWHFRYVGIPHSFIMVENQLCLEEYIDYLKKYKFGEEHLKKVVFDYEYEIYYIPSSGNTTEIYVPKTDDYTISGNNVDGFIVTICRKADPKDISSTNTTSNDKITYTNPKITTAPSENETTKTTSTITNETTKVTTKETIED